MIELTLSLNKGGEISLVRSETLEMLGMDSKKLFLKGDNLSIFSASLLHASFEHLLSNCVGIYCVGFVLEGIVSALRTAGVSL